MRSMNRLFVVGGLLLATVGAANAAPTTVLDTITSNQFAAGTGTLLGYDASITSINSLSKTAFSAVDFTLDASGAGSVASVQTSVALIAPVQSGIPTNDLYGAFVKVTNPGGTLASQTLVSFTGGLGSSSAFFQFDTAAGKNPTNGRGNGVRNDFSAILSGNGPTLAAGEYYLVLAGTTSLTASSTSGVLDYARQLTAATGTNAASAFSTYNGSKYGYTNGGALVAPTGRNTNFGARIGVNVAAVPEASTMVPMAFSLVTIGGLALRRRRAVK